MNNLLVLLPAYNEEENVGKLIKSWYSHAENLKNEFSLNLKIVVINDGSTDKTKSICEELRKDFDITLINHKINKGLGEAVKTGIFYAISDYKNASFACIMDCDNTQDPKYIFDMLRKAGAKNKDKLDYDVVIASRYQKGSEIFGVSKFRILLSSGAKYVFSSILKVKNAKDYTCGYRLYGIDILKKAYERFGDTLIEESGFTCMTELLYKLSVVNARFAEIPFSLRYDFKKGESKMKIIKTVINSFELAFRLKKINKT